MDGFKVLLVLICLVEIAIFCGDETSQLDDPKGPCPGVEYRTEFSILAFFFHVEEVTYCVDNIGNEVDCEMACPQTLCDLEDIQIILRSILLISICVKLPTWVRINLSLA